jgi:outer membrane beta-barrel protein
LILVEMKLSRREWAMKRIFLDRMSMMAILFLLPYAASAQDDGEMSFSESEVEEAEPSAPSGDEAPTGEGEAAPEAAGGEAAAEAGGEVGGEVSEADVLSALGTEEGLESTTSLDADGKGGALDVSKDPNVGKHPIWAVQRIYVLRARRVNLDINFGISMNDPYVQHQAISLSLAYYITEVLAIGLSGNWYKGLGAQTDLNFSSRRATHQVVPINEYFGGAQLNFLYVPIFGKFAMFKQWILHWDMWVIGGGGFLFSRPIPVIDPDVRDFDYSIKYCFNVGIGWRLFFTRFIGVSLELRDYIYPEELESLTTWPAEHPNRYDDDLWLQDEHALTNNVMLSVGLTLMIPFTVKYRLKK